jgi:protoporphyrinogen oxidase
VIHDTVVVGAGVGGLAAAIRLAERGRTVVVVDPAPRVGGLAGGFEVGGSSVERYYHHIFRSDTTIQRWIGDLGLGSRLDWLPASMGFYAGGRLLRFGTPASLLRFPLLSLQDRVRLGLRVRELSRVDSPAQFEHIAAVDWLRARASLAEMRVFWMPLLRAKFGNDADRVSMAWLWARFRARVGGGSILGQERLGYLRGGFQQLGDAMAERARSLGVELRLGARVEGVEVEAGAIRAVATDSGRLETQSVVWTPSLNAVARVIPELPESVRDACASIAYHSAIVVVVELAASAIPYYWVTIGDSGLPFTVAVEHTRLVSPTDYGGRSIVYLGRYAPVDDPVTQLPDEILCRRFLEAAGYAFGAALREPLAAHVFRAPGAQPIVPPGWGRARPPVDSGIDGLVLANMAQIYPWDRGMNYSLALGESAAEALLRRDGGSTVARTAPGPAGARRT